MFPLSFEASFTEQFIFEGFKAFVHIYITSYVL